MAEARSKEFRFPLGVEWAGGRKVVVNVDGKAPLEVATPPEFRGTEPSVWSPEDLFVASAAACLAVTFAGLAEREQLAFGSLSVGGEGIVGRREDGRFGFARVDLSLAVRVAPGDEVRARALAEKAEETCLVSVSLDLPVELEIDVRSAAAA
jgi:organic hydroperoxide reductase OsmC/OhrA